MSRTTLIIAVLLWLAVDIITLVFLNQLWNPRQPPDAVELEAIPLNEDLDCTCVCYGGQ